jgi:predicted enzyme related to lactoylglutathione lyase
VIDEAGAMTWREVNTPDAAKARDFYGKVFGLEARKLEGQMEYWTLHKGDTTVGGVLQMTKEWAGVPPHWMNYFAVPDADAAAKKIAELGGKVSVPPFDTPYGRIAVVNDPTGAVFSVVRLPKK